MTTYEESGVNIDLGDKCSKIAYEAAKGTFKERKGKIGEPVLGEGGFAGLLDMGDFYLVQNDDGVGTKIQIAEAIEKYDTLGYDLLAMVADDAVCLGAEPISVSNTLDVNKVDPGKVEALMKGLKNAAIEHQIVIPGGEIAELGKMVNGYLWNATCVAVVEKSKLISGGDIQAGDKIIGLHSAGLRSNGFSLVRHILSEKFGNNWYSEKFDDVQTWGEATLTPSKIYCSAILDMHGRFGEEPKVQIKGIAHVTGGGIYDNLNRITKNYELKNLPGIPELMKKLMELGDVSKDEAYRTWNMGLGMILISNDVDQIQEICTKHKITAQEIGRVV